MARSESTKSEFRNPKQFQNDEMQNRCNIPNKKVRNRRFEFSSVLGLFGRRFVSDFEILILSLFGLRFVSDFVLRISDFEFDLLS